MRGILVFRQRHHNFPVGPRFPAGSDVLGEFGVFALRRDPVSFVVSILVSALLRCCQRVVVGSDQFAIKRRDVVIIALLFNAIG